MVDDLGPDFPVGTQFILEDIRMIGTPDYTCLGRPTVGNARVVATVEERTRTEKVIIFKKIRRQGYQKSQGHRSFMNILRIDRVEHDIDETDL